MTGSQYRVAVMEALQRCTPMPFTEALGGAGGWASLRDPVPRNQKYFTPNAREKRA